MTPSLISLRLSSARIEHVNTILTDALPQLESALQAGSMVTIEDHALRIRPLPIS